MFDLKKHLNYCVFF